MPITRKPASARKPVTKPVEADEEEYEEEEEGEYFPPPKKASKPKPVARDEDDDDDDEEDDEEDESDAPGLRSGWGGAQQNRQETSNYPNELKLTDDPTLLMFLENEPLVAYKQHWIERKGKKSFACIAPEFECPICAIGEGVRNYNVFNVLQLTPGNAPINVILRAGVRLSDILQAKAKKPGLLGRYWGVSTTGKGTNTNYEVTLVKERDLEEDWEVDPLTEDAIESFTAKKWSQKAAVQVQGRKELLAVVKESIGNYDDDDDED